MKRVILNMAAVLGIAVLALCMTQPASAATVTIDFGTGNAGVGGSFSLVGGNAYGVGIPIGSVTISGAPSNDGVFLVGGGACGANGGIQTSCGALSFNTSTGAISITGTITSLGITTSENLLTGTITSFTASANGLTNASGPDTKAANLLTALGLPTNTQFNLFGFSLTTSGTIIGPNALQTITSTDIRNTSTPEPGTLVMFGSGLLGLAGIIRRKLNA